VHTTGYSDEDTIRLLRGLQRKIIGLGQGPTDDG
jgi:hypothetical protein